MTILIDINNLIEEANAVTSVAKPVTTTITTAAKPVGSMIANLHTGATKALRGAGKTWNTLSPMAKTAIVGAGGLGAAGLGLAAGHTLGAAAFAPAANFLHLAPASGALHALNPAAAPLTFGSAMLARKAIQNHYNG